MEFWKMSGAGNDFIIIDNQGAAFEEAALRVLARKLCHRRFGIGADGLMVVEKPRQGGDYAMRFFNSDGTSAEMCGNGARCICRYGYERGLAGETQRVETAAGMVTGWRLNQEQYRVRLNSPSILDQARQSQQGETGYVELGQPGVPHCLFRVKGLADMTLDALRPLGRSLRYDPAYPKGANANLYDVLGKDHLLLRTFERGVEDFTYACGTGTGSLVALLTVQGVVSGKAVQVDNPGGRLIVDTEMSDGVVRELYLTGPASVICRGQAEPEEMKADGSRVCTDL